MIDLWEWTFVEMTKMGLNVYLATKISFINEMAIFVNNVGRY